MVVATATPETLLEASEFREVVDGVAARLAAERGDLDLNERLERAIGTQKEALEPWNKVQFMENDAEFHVAILEASGNQYVAAQTAVIRLATQVFRPVLGFDSHDAQKSIHEHQRIAEAIKVGDGIGAELWARAHIRVGISAISQLPEQDRI
jgi:DNA-binding GntR family transcriptional regulator